MKAPGGIVRCDECKTEPITPGHYCECCGRKLSLQERKALDEKKPSPTSSQTSWGEPAPVLPKRPKGDRLVGVHFTPEPEPYVDEMAEAPEPYADPLIDARFASLEAARPEPTVPVVAHVAIDPILEAHFAGHAPVEAAPSSPLAVPVPVAPVPAPHVVETHVAVPLSVDAPPVDVPAAHLDSDAPAARCESCGGPADDGDLCSACQKAFHSLLDSTIPAPPAAEAIAHVPEVNAPPSLVVASAVPAASATPKIAIKPRIEVKQVTIEQPPAVPAAPRQEAVPSRPRSPKPVAPVSTASVHPSARPSRARTIAAAAAVVVVVAAIGFPLGKLWLDHQDSSAIVRDEPTPVVKPAPEPAPELAVTPPSVVATAATTARDESPVPLPQKAAAETPVQPKPAASATTRTAAARVTPKGVRQPVKPAWTVVPVAAPGPVAAAPPPEVPAPAPVVAPEPKAEPPAPIGPFFELRDVNETPRVATRVEPQVPDDLRDRQVNEVVIVRVLVTQSGHPLTINLLRRSKAGPSLDNAIVAAVKQWTFVPARRRGEAVSCWYHVGVPVGRTN